MAAPDDVMLASLIVEAAATRPHRPVAGGEPCPHGPSSPRSDFPPRGIYGRGGDDEQSRRLATEDKIENRNAHAGTLSRAVAAHLTRRNRPGSAALILRKAFVRRDAQDRARP
jgi:hypothetical protein